MWWKIGIDELVGVDLTDEERSLLWEGLHQWGGPARSSNDLAVAMGFADVEALHAEGRRIREALEAGAVMSKRDWQRALVATEIVWASSVYGAAGDWEIVAAGWDDQRTLRVLRQIQHKLAGLRSPPRERGTRRRGAGVSAGASPPFGQPEIPEALAERHDRLAALLVREGYPSPEHEIHRLIDYTRLWDSDDEPVRAVRVQRRNLLVMTTRRLLYPMHFLPLRLVERVECIDSSDDTCEITVANVVLLNGKPSPRTWRAAFPPDTAHSFSAALAAAGAAARTAAG